MLENGKTKAVYDYRAAIRERVFIPQPGIDQDGNGQMDWVTADIMRPSEGSATNKMPAIIDPSPYYTTVCRGAEGQCMADWNNDNVNDRWPLFYDNYFVPRGYAYILGQMNGTGYTTNGCPMHGGPGDIAGEKSIVDWLNGRVPGYSAASTTATPMVAAWHNGSSAMIGKSYDGTLANGVAATGVEGPQDDRPGLGDFRLVQLLAHRRRPPQHELPGRPEQQRHDRGRQQQPARREPARPASDLHADERADLRRRERAHRGR